MYCYLELKLRYLKNPKLFSIRVPESYEPIVFWKKKAAGLSSFYKHLMKIHLVELKCGIW